MKSDKNYLALLLLVLLLLTPFSSALELSQLNVLDLDGRIDGKERDTTSMYDYGARYYDPFFMHFTQPDETVTDIYNPQDLNRYAYVRNNPYKYVDPDGEIPWDIIDIGFIAYGAYQFARDPSWGRAGELGLDVGFAVLPFVPNVNRIKEAAKALDKAKDVGKTAENAADLKSFTKGNFRENVGKVEGRPLTSAEEAHHILPQKFEKEGRFSELGINIHDPQFGAIVNKQLHREGSYVYNKEFEAFLRNPNIQKTAANVVQKGQGLTRKQFGGNVARRSTSQSARSRPSSFGSNRRRSSGGRRWVTKTFLN